MTLVEFFKFVAALPALREQLALLKEQKAAAQFQLQLSESRCKQLESQKEDLNAENVGLQKQLTECRQRLGALARGRDLDDQLRGF
jgi:chromosome segregation ATPase